MPIVIEDEYENEIVLEESDSDSLVDEIAPQAEVANEEVEDKDYTSIIDLISDAKDNNEIEVDDSNNESPDLFSTTSETLNKDSSLDSDTRAEETDEDYLEIPAFLRRQSK